eukprot:scaffold36571_cov144-Skeletonema_dohrnii-CCMP3373.AAC.2
MDREAQAPLLPKIQVARSRIKNQEARQNPAFRVSSYLHKRPIQYIICMQDAIKCRARRRGA